MHEQSIQLHSDWLIQQMSLCLIVNGIYTESFLSVQRFYITFSEIVSESFAVEF